MVIASRMAALLGMCDVTDELLSLLVKYGFDISCEYTACEVFDSLLSDKKRRGGTISVVLPRAVGDCTLVALELDELKELLTKVMA